MKSPFRAFWEPQGLVYHGLALSYAVFTYLLGIAGLFQASWLINVPATLLLAHGMTIAAYLIHECGHNTIFKSNDANARLGRFLNWIAGSAYGTFEDIRYKHFRHHIDNDDLAWFDYPAFFNRHPGVLKITQWLEWCYIPAQEIIMHAIMMFASFLIPQRRDQRLRNLTVLLIRGGLYTAALIFAPKAALLYAVAYMLTLHVLRFMDCLQHDYGGNFTLFDNKPSLHRGDRDWEQAHTFSNPLSLRFDWLNWLTLNFGFHNAHHAKPVTPWYRLPALHRELFGNDARDVIPFAAQTRIFNRFRVPRVIHAGGEFDHLQGCQGEDYLRAARDVRVYGGNAVSFLTSF